MKFLDRMNGWQRLWFAVTALSFVCIGVVYPLDIVYRGNPGQNAYREMLLKDLRSEKCRPYVTQPVAELREPPISNYGMDCSAIYLSRKAAIQDVYPYSIELYDARELARKLEGLYPLMALSSCLTLAASALLYALGLGIASTRQRFNQTA